MTAVLIAGAAGLGVHLVVRRREPTGDSAGRRVIRRVVEMVRSAVGRELAAAVVCFGILGATVGGAVFGGGLAAGCLGIFAATLPVSSHRHRRRVARDQAHDAWPRMVEEIRIQTSSLGRSVPNALFAVGRRAPDALRPAFDAAHREWLLTTDFARAAQILGEQLADAAVDVTLETLVVAHDLGAIDLDARLAALAEDRRQDVQGRKDARSRLAGARFARRFVLAVPFGMAAAGMSIGSGRDAYRSPTGQLVVAIAVALVAVCWFWSGHVMRLPTPPRPFAAR